MREAVARGFASGLILVMSGLLAGCAEVAESGPTASAVESGASLTLPYRLVPITPAIVAAVLHAEPDRLAGRFPNDPPPTRLVLGIGDVLSVNVYEASVGGLFVPGDTGSRPGNYVSLPNQRVDNNGNISFPFGGEIRAKGRTPQELQDTILARIKNRAIDPQVIVAVVSQETSLVSVQGEVITPSRYPAAAVGARDRVSDAIARAGGLSGTGPDSWITLERNGKSVTVPFEALLSLPNNDIFVQPGDRILVTRDPQRFIALGAFSRRVNTVSDALGSRRSGIGPVLDTGRAEIPFDSWRLSLSAAIAKAGGLSDERASPGSVFLYRREPAAVARRLGLDPGPVDVVPIIYQLDLGDPSGFVLATRFPIRNGDILYVANARLVEVSKAVSVFASALSTAASASTAALLGADAVRGNGTGLTDIAGRTVVPSGINLPGTVTTSGLGTGTTTTTATGGTTDTGGTTRTGITNTQTSQTAITTLTTPRSTMTSPASR